jgi:hypothetical protein
VVINATTQTNTPATSFVMSSTNGSIVFIVVVIFLLGILLHVARIFIICPICLAIIAAIVRPLLAIRLELIHYLVAVRLLGLLCTGLGASPKERRDCIFNPKNIEKRRFLYLNRLGLRLCLNLASLLIGCMLILRCIILIILLSAQVLTTTTVTSSTKIIANLLPRTHQRAL